MWQLVTIRSRAVTNSPRRTLNVMVALALAATAAPFDVPTAVGAAGTLRVALADDVVLDPHKGPLPGSWVAARLIHRGLFAFPHEAHPGGSTPVPDLADGPLRKIGPSLYEVTVGDARFSNGDPMTAADVVVSLRRFARSSSPVSRFTWPIRTIEELTPATDPPVIRIDTARAMPELAYVLAHPSAAILPAETPSRTGRLGPRGLGPYRVTSRLLEKKVVLARNPHWSDVDDPVRSAEADQVVLRVDGSGSAALTSVSQDRAEMVGDPGPPDVLDRDRATVHSAGRCTRIVAINHRRSELDRLVNRRAIRDVLEGIDLRTRATAPAASLLPPTVVGARERPRPTEDRQIRIGKRLVLAASDTPRDRKEASEIADRLRDAGARVQVQRRNPALHGRLLAAAASVRPDLLLFTWCAEWPGTAGRTFLEPLTGSGKLAPRSSSLSDAMVRAATSPAVDAEAEWRRAERILRDSATLVPVGWPGEPAAFRTFSPGPLTSPMFPQGDPAGSVPTP